MAAEEASSQHLTVCNCTHCSPLEPFWLGLLSPSTAGIFFLFLDLILKGKRMERKLFLAATVTCGESASHYNHIRNHFSANGSPYGGAGKRKCARTHSNTHSLSTTVQLPFSSFFLFQYLPRSLPLLLVSWGSGDCRWLVCPLPPSCLSVVHPNSSRDPVHI